LNPHAVRADDLDHPDELRVDLDPGPGVPWDDIRRVALVVREVLEDMGLVGWPKTSGSRGIHVNVRTERRWSFDEVRRAALALAREVERRAPAIATSKWWKEERHGVFLDYNQNAKDRTVASAYSVRPVPDARVSAPLTWDELPACELGDFTIATVPARFAAIGDPAAGIDLAAGSIEKLLELSAEQAKAGQGDAPWPPNYAKAPGEPPRVAPSRARKGGGDGAVSPAKTAASTARAPSPTGRRTSKKPLIEIARAATKQDALAGRATKTSFRIWRRRTCWSIRCADASRSGTASASTSSTCRSRSAPRRSRSTLTTTRGRSSAEATRLRSKGCRRSVPAYRPKISVSSNGAVDSSWS